MKTFILIFLTSCVTGSVYDPQVCKTQSVNVPGSGFAIPGDYETKTSKSFDLSQLSELSTLQVVGGGISNGQNLDFIKTMNVSLVNNNDSVVLLNYTSSGTGTTDIVVPSNQKNLVSLVSGNSLTLSVDIDGSIPENDWNLNAELCLAASIDKTYSF